MFVLNNRLSETDEIINMILNLGGVGDYVFFVFVSHSNPCAKFNFKKTTKSHI
jgi:hypothetical protein